MCTLDFVVKNHLIHTVNSFSPGSKFGVPLKREIHYLTSHFTLLYVVHEYIPQTKHAYLNLLDFKLSPCSVCCMFSSG
jgi:hypothetical protein